MAETEAAEKVVPFDEVILESNEPAKRKPGRPRKSPIDATVEETADKPKRGRRSRKLTGSQVSEGIELASTFVVMMTGYEHWHIPQAETSPYSTQMAELLNQIPAKYLQGVLDTSNYLIIAIGTYQTLAPRIQEQQRINRQKKAEAYKQQEFQTTPMNQNNWGS
jgi:hypothetical protein